MGDKRQLLPLIALHYFIGPEKGATLFLSLIYFAQYRSFIFKYLLQILSSHTLIYMTYLNGNNLEFLYASIIHKESKYYHRNIS